MCGSSKIKPLATARPRTDQAPNEQERPDRSRTSRLARTMTTGSRGSWCVSMTTTTERWTCWSCGVSPTSPWQRWAPIDKLICGTWVCSSVKQSNSQNLRPPIDSLIRSLIKTTQKITRGARFLFTAPATKFWNCYIRVGASIFEFWCEIFGCWTPSKKEVF